MIDDNLSRQDVLDIGAWFNDETRMNIGRDVQGKALSLVGDNLRLRDELDHESAAAKEFANKYHEAMNIMGAWKNIDHAEAISQLLALKEEQRREREAFKEEMRNGFKDLQRVEKERDAFKVERKNAMDHFLTLEREYKNYKRMTIQFEQDRDLYKRLWELRGKALEQPCLSCGYTGNQIRMQNGEIP